MESSTVLAFRIFVMLSCLIIVPMAAIFGSAFPDVVKSVLVDRVVAWSTGKPVESSEPEPQGDGFREVTPNPSTIAAQSEIGPAPRWNAPQADPASWQTPPGTASGVVPVAGASPADGFNRSASFSAPADHGPAAAPTQPNQSTPGESPYHRATGEQPLGAPGAPPLTADAARDPSRNPDKTACPLEQPERFTEMERRLRQYGATYYLLETWGNNGELYRFHCRMAVGSDARYTRHFEATDRDALTAMSQVLERVEAWRAGRLQ